MPVSLGELATRFGCELIGDPEEHTVPLLCLQFLQSVSEESLRDVWIGGGAGLARRDEGLAANSEVAEVCVGTPLGALSPPGRMVQPPSCGDLASLAGPGQQRRSRTGQKPWPDSVFSSITTPFNPR